MTRITSGRTPYIRNLLKAMKRARFVNAHPELKNAVHELVEAERICRTSDYSRREFLKMAGQAGIIVSIAQVPFAKRVLAEVPKALGGAPVAIVGAGFAGLTTAYRLMKAGIPCEIFEGRPDRVGGRVFTKYNFNQDNMFVELGAELVDSDHEDLMNLCGELGLEIQSIVGEDANVEPNLYYFGGKYYTDSDLIPLFQPLAERLDRDQKAAFPEEANDFTEAAKKLDQMSIAQYLEANKSGVEPWILKMLDVAYANEYGLSTDQQSAVNFVNYISPDTKEGFKLFGDSDESKRIMGGNSKLHEALQAALEAGKVKINMGYELKALRTLKDGRIRLSFDTMNVASEAAYSQVVSCIAFSVLRGVDGLDKIGLSDLKLRGIREMGYGTNTKFMANFTERVWRKDIVKNGVTIKANCGSLLTDLPFQQAWECSRGQKGQSGILTNFMGGDRGKNYGKEQIAQTIDFMDEMVPGLKDAHNNQVAAYQWPKFKWTKGAYSCPLVGQATTIMPNAPESELEGRLLFAGEHTSVDYGGFMNGAVESGNRAAKEIIESRAGLIPAPASQPSPSSMPTTRTGTDG